MVWPGLSLRDYSQTDLLLFKSGKHGRVHRQKGASPVSHILENPRRLARDYGLEAHWDVVWRDCEIRLSLYLLGRLKSPEEQRALDLVDRLYRIDHQWPKWPAGECHALFDQCRSPSVKAPGGQVAISIPGTHPRRVAAKR